MEWVPEHAWLTKVVVDAKVGQLQYDLAIDASGQGSPSYVAAGLAPVAGDIDLATLMLLPILAVLVASGSAMATVRRQAVRRSIV